MRAMLGVMLLSLAASAEEPLRSVASEEDAADFIKSEAGMATLMDRKVNTGNLGNLPSIASSIAATNDLRTVDALSQFEGEIVRQLRFRKDYLADSSLSQPSFGSRNSRASRSKPLTSRKGTRKGRGA